MADITEEPAPESAPALEPERPKQAKKPPVKLIVILAIVVVAVVAIGIPAIRGVTNEPVFLTTTDLEKVVNVSKLSTAEFVYNGIADKYKDDGSVEFHVKYAASVKAGVDMGQITFEVDDEAKTVRPILPSIDISRPVIDSSSLDYMPSNPSVELKDVLTLCEEDALQETQASSDIYNVAEENLRSTVEGLLLPLLENSGYTLVWDAVDSSEADAGGDEGGAATSDTESSANADVGDDAETEEASDDAQGN